MNRSPIAPDEWYHCYTRGVDKRVVFEKTGDYKRFLNLLYLCNSDKPLHRSDHNQKLDEEIYTVERSEPLVSIGAYCLMPNHFHLLLKDNSENGNGISRFMQKLGTSYTMYFNLRKERTGNLFVKPFRSKHVHDDRYFKRVVQYIHFNPIELYEPKWKEGKFSKLRKIEQQLKQYPYSSLIDYQNKKRTSRPEEEILDKSLREVFDTDHESLADSIQDMHEYYAGLSL